jgi:hypothetical protein
MDQGFLELAEERRERNRPRAAAKVAEQMVDQEAGIAVMLEQIGQDARNQRGEIRHIGLR